ncbi:MAG TPA: hypothetical protein VND98_02285 [Solirubrobacterales bacterium]|nr:hypothetical protein [Solirubrobacterales bacterium]
MTADRPNRRFAPRSLLLALGVLAACCVSVSTAQAFSPSFAAGTVNTHAGAFSPETVTISRTGEGEELGSIALHNPPGLLGMLSRVRLCGDSAAQAARCPASSEIGTVTVGLGPDFSPLYSEGGVYLTGPYKGAPFGLAVAVPVLAGPFQLGEVGVRAKLSLDPSSASLSIESDPLPQSFDGVSLQIRTIHLDLDRKGFIFNPTSCRPGAIQATVISTTGAVASAQSRFQATRCAALAFRPQLALRLTGQADRGGHPKLTAVVKVPRGTANLKGIAITMPPTELIDSAHLQDPCTQAVFAEGSTPGERCPPGSVIGHARALTPALGAPLRGLVYLRSSGRKLPDLVVALNGQVEIDVAARIDAVHGGLRAAFAALPDVPLSKLTLALEGGDRGLLENSANLCASAARAGVRMAGQNGKRVGQAALLGTGCHRR